MVKNITWLQPSFLLTLQRHHLEPSRYDAATILWEPVKHNKSQLPE